MSTPNYSREGLLMDFCKLFEQLYGLHHHPRPDCVLDFGTLGLYILFGYSALSVHTCMSGQYYGGLREELLVHACSLEQSNTTVVTIKPSFPKMQRYVIAVGHNNCALLSLYESTASLTASLTIDGFVLGSANSRYVTKSHVMACHGLSP